MTTTLAKQKQYKLLSVKTVELDQTYDYLHFHVTLEYKGQELELCIQFADLLVAIQYYNYGLYRFITAVIKSDDYRFRCDDDRLLVPELQAEGITLEELVAPLLDHTDIKKLWENTTGRILDAAGAGQRKVTEEEWIAYYDAIDPYEHVPGLHASHYFVELDFYGKALALCMEYFPELSEVTLHSKHEVRVQVQEFVGECFSFFDYCSYLHYEEPDEPANNHAPSVEELRNRLIFRKRYDTRPNPIFCVELDREEHLWESTGENSTLLGYKVTTKDGEFYDQIEMDNMESLARVEFPDSYLQIEKAYKSVEGVSPKERETYEYLSSIGFDWTPMLEYYVFNHVDILWEIQSYQSLTSDGSVEPGVPIGSTKDVMGEEWADESRPYVQKEWMLYDALRKLMVQKIKQRNPEIFETPLSGGYWYYHTRFDNDSAYTLAHFVAAVVMACNDILSDYDLRYD